MEKQEYVKYKDFANLKDKQRSVGGHSKGKIGSFNGESFLIKPTVAEEYFGTKLLNQLNPELFQNIMFIVKDDNNISGLVQEGTILTANMIIQSFVDMLHMQRKAEDPEEMFVYITLIKNYGIDLGTRNDLSYNNYGYILDKFGKEKAFVLDHELAFGQLGAKYACLKHGIGALCSFDAEKDYKLHIEIDKNWKKFISSANHSDLVNRFTKHCSKIFDDCTEEKMDAAIEKIHLEVMNREVELRDFFNMDSIASIIGEDSKHEYLHISYHSYEDILDFFVKLSGHVVDSVGKEEL